MWHVELTPGAEESATRVSLTAVTERVHSDGAILPGQQYSLRMMLSKLDSKEVYYDVSKWNFTWSVFAICPCLQLHKYVSKVSQIWFFGWRSKANIEEPALHINILLVSAVSRFVIPRLIFLPLFRIQKHQIPHCKRSWSVPKMHMSLFMIWATLP